MVPSTESQFKHSFQGGSTPAGTPQSFKKKKKTQTTQMEYYDLAEENKKLTSFSSLNVTKRVVGETVF